jgi:RNA polymerase sigma factor (sigma-70 family)
MTSIAAIPSKVRTNMDAASMDPAPKTADQHKGLLVDSSPIAFSELIQRGAQGDDAALGHVLDHYIRKLYNDARRLISKRLRALIDPADLLQSTRIILWVGLRNGKLKVESSPQLMGLARTILRRQAARVCRALKSEFGNSTIEFRFADTMTDMPLMTGIESDPSEQTEAQDVVHRILNELDDVDRELIRYRLLGYTTAYVARQLKMPPGSLRVRLGRLRKRLLEYGSLQHILMDD